MCCIEGKFILFLALGQHRHSALLSLNFMCNKKFKNTERQGCQMDSITRFLTPFFA